jgi:hypothetical protein
MDLLRLAVQLDHFEVVKVLVLDKRVNSYVMDENGYTHFHNAIMLGSDYMVTCLLQQSELNPNFCTADGRHP